MQYFPKDTLSKLFIQLMLNKKCSTWIRTEIPEHIEIRVDILYLFVRPENFMRDNSKKIAIFDPHTNSYDTLPLERIYNEIPFRMVMIRVYTRSTENFEEVKQAVSKALSVDEYRQKTSM